MSKKKRKSFHPTAVDLTAKVLHIFRASPRKPFNTKQLLSRLRITNQEDKHKLAQSLKILIHKEEIEEVERGKYRLKSQLGYIIGKVDSTPYGTAYIISPEMDEDVFISPPNLNHAMHGDTVRVFLFAGSKGRRPE